MNIIQKSLQHGTTYATNRLCNMIHQQDNSATIWTQCTATMPKLSMPPNFIWTHIVVHYLSVAHYLSVVHYLSAHQCNLIKVAQQQFPTWSQRHSPEWWFTNVILFWHTTNIVKQSHQFKFSIAVRQWQAKSTFPASALLFTRKSGLTGELLSNE